MAVSCIKPCTTLLITPDGTHQVCLEQGAITSERVDEVYQLQRLVVFTECLPCEIELNWIFDIRGKRWVVEHADSLGCMASLTLVAPRLSCPEIIQIWTTADFHGCTSEAEPILQIPNVKSFWVQTQSKELFVNEATVFDETYTVHLECDAQAVRLGVNSLLKRHGCLFEVTTLEHVGVPTKLPVVTCKKLHGYNALGEN